MTTYKNEKMSNMELTKKPGDELRCSKYMSNIKTCKQLFLFLITYDDDVINIVIFMNNKYFANPISTDNIWKLCGMELKDILIQQEFNFLGNDRTIIPERKRKR
jgi:hypothetical protein